MAARATARFTATVVLPTPPLPEPIATMFSTPGNGCGAVCGEAFGCPWAKGNLSGRRWSFDYTCIGLNLFIEKVPEITAHFNHDRPAHKTTQTFCLIAIFASLSLGELFKEFGFE